MKKNDSQSEFALLGVGNALLDIQANVPDGMLADLAVAKGSMNLVNDKRVREIYSKMKGSVESSGGSAANTVAIAAALGADVAFSGKVANDQFGEIFQHDLRSQGIHFSTPPLLRPGLDTGRCLVMVTPEGERTMFTCLGASSEYSSADIDESLVARSAVIFLEGYLFDRPEGKKAFHDTAALAQNHGRKVALSLSDPFCVERHREDFLRLAQKTVNIIFANEKELKALYKTYSFQDACARISAHVDIAVITRSEKGAVVLAESGSFEIAAAPPARLIDTTGAGDSFAGAFLYALSRDLSLETCGHYGAEAASIIIAQKGARPPSDFKERLTSALEKK